MSALLSRDEVLQALKVSGEGGVSNMRTPHVRLYEDKTKQKKRMEGFLQAPRVLRGIERWSKLWFVLYRDFLEGYTQPNSEPPVCSLPLSDLIGVEIFPWVDSSISPSSTSSSSTTPPPSSQKIADGLYVICLYCTQNRIFVFGKVGEKEATKWYTTLSLSVSSSSCPTFSLAVSPPPSPSSSARSLGSLSSSPANTSEEVVWGDKKKRRGTKKGDSVRSHTGVVGWEETGGIGEKLTKTDKRKSLYMKPFTPDRKRSATSVRGSAIKTGVVPAKKENKKDGRGLRPQDRHNNEHFYHDNERIERGTHEKVSDVVIVNVNRMDVITNTITFPTGVYITQLSVSAQCCVAVAVDGRVFSWGDQDAASPLLGIGVTSRHVQPTPIEMKTPFPKKDKVVRASCGMMTSALISSEGRVALWGRVLTSDGKDLESVSEPEIFRPLDRKFVTKVVTFFTVCFALVRVPGMDDITEVWSWGCNENSLLAHTSLLAPPPQSPTPTPSPSSVPSPPASSTSSTLCPPEEIHSLSNETVTDLSVSETHAMAVTSKGEVFVWGKNCYRKEDKLLTSILHPEEKEILTRPTKVPFFGPQEDQKSAVKGEAGMGFSLVLTSTNEVFAWGYTGNRNTLGVDEDVLEEKDVPNHRCLRTPSRVTTKHPIQEVHTGGSNSLAKANSGGLYVWGNDVTDNAENKTVNFIPHFKFLKNGLILGAQCSYKKFVVLRSTDYARIFYQSDERIISSGWHQNLGQVMSLIQRIWEVERGSYCIFDALGYACYESDSTSEVIQRMLVNDVEPVFFVMDFKRLFSAQREQLRLKGETIQWADKEMLLKLLFLFPSSVIIAPDPSKTHVSKECKPPRKYGYAEVFFLTYSRNFRFEPMEILEGLKECFYSLLQKKEEYEQSKGQKEEKSNEGLKKETEKETKKETKKEMKKETKKDPKKETKKDGKKKRGSRNLKKERKWQTPKKKGQVEEWFPPHLPYSTLLSLQHRLIGTRLQRILTSLRIWLELRPEDFVSGEIIHFALDFLNQQCESSDVLLRTTASNVKRAFLSRLSKKRKIGTLKKTPSSAFIKNQNETSLLLRYNPKVLAEQITFIDANQVFSQISHTDILHQRSPSAIFRHGQLGCWVEREVLECSSSSKRTKTIEAILEVMYHLQALRNWFSFSAFYGAFQQRGMRKMTDKVWDTGAHLRPRYVEMLNDLKAKSEVLKFAARFNIFFEELPNPKLPFLGHVFQKLIYLNEQNKTPPSPKSPSSPSTLSPPSSPQFLSSSPSYLVHSQSPTRSSLSPPPSRGSLSRSRSTPHVETSASPSDNEIEGENEIENAIEQENEPEEQTEEDQSEKEQEREQEGLRWLEGAKPEVEVVMWLKDVFGLAISGYTFPAIPPLVSALSKVKGFGKDHTQHRSIADKYSTNMDKIDKNPLKNSAEASPSSALASSGGIGGEDLEVTLLTARAALVSISERMRGDVWSEWFFLLRREKTDGSLPVFPSSPPVSPPSSPLHFPPEEIGWEKVKGRMKKIQNGGEEERWEGDEGGIKRGEGCFLFQSNGFDLGSFSHLFFRSQALEVTVDKILESFPSRDENITLFVQILSLIFGDSFGAKFFLKAIQELSKNPAAVDMVKKNDVFTQFLATARNFQRFTFLTEETFSSQIKDIKSILSDFRAIISNWETEYDALPFPSSKWSEWVEEKQESVWDAYVYLNNFKDNFVFQKSDTDFEKLSASYCLPGFKKAIDVIKESQKGVTRQHLSSLQDKAKLVEEHLQSYLASLSESISNASFSPDLSVSYTQLSSAMENLQNEHEKEGEEDPSMNLTLFVDFLSSAFLPQLENKLKIMEEVVDLTNQSHSEIKSFSSKVVLKQSELCAKEDENSKFDNLTIYNRMAQLNLLAEKSKKNQKTKPVPQVQEVVESESEESDDTEDIYDEEEDEGSEE